MKKLAVQLIFSILVFVSFSFAQEPIPLAIPTPPNEEPIKVSTEEVHLNVMARSSSSGQFVSTLKKDDLLIVEDGVPQEISDLKRVPANVLLVLDTGSELNFAKNLKATRLIGEIFVRSLPPNNSLSLMQYYDKVETLSDWSTDYKGTLQALKTKLFTGRRSRLTEALNSAVERFKMRPLENRHLVLISDGVETVADDAEQQKALQNLLAANITLHIISYTQLEEQQAQQASQIIKRGKKTKPRIDPMIYEEMIHHLPEEIRINLRQLNENPPVVVINLDPSMIRRVREKREIWRENQIKLQALAAETGGIFQAPEEFGTMLTLAIEIARAVDSQYVLTYMPKKPFTNSEKRDKRKVRVSTHCPGIEIQSREKLF